jgi:hypothetical protein
MKLANIDQQVEHLMYRYALQVPLCGRASMYPAEVLGYATWKELGNDRHKRPGNVLWHDACAIEEYWLQARVWSLSFKREDFLM